MCSRNGAELLPDNVRVRFQRVPKMYASLLTTEIRLELLTAVDGVDTTGAGAPIAEIPLEIGECPCQNLLFTVGGSRFKAPIFSGAIDQHDLIIVSKTGR